MKTSAPPSLAYKLFIQNYRWMQFLWAASNYPTTTARHAASQPSNQTTSQWFQNIDTNNWICNEWLITEQYRKCKEMETTYTVSWYTAAQTHSIYWKTVACDFPWKIMLSIAGLCCWCLSLILIIIIFLYFVVCKIPNDVIWRPGKFHFTSSMLQSFYQTISIVTINLPMARSEAIHLRNIILKLDKCNQ